MGKPKKTIEDLHSDLDIVKRQDQLTLKGGFQKGKQRNKSRFADRFNRVCSHILPQ